MNDLYPILTEIGWKSYHIKQKLYFSEIGGNLKYKNLKQFS